MPLDGVRDFIARHVIKDVPVYRIDDFRMDRPEIVKTPRRVATQRMYPKIKVEVSKTIDFESVRLKMRCTAKKAKFLTEPVHAKNVKIKRFVKQDVKTHTMSFDKKIRTSSGLKQVQALPQERGNTLKLQKKRPNVANNEMLLACYGPIVEGAVEKLVLNKQRGTLLIWYKPGSRQFKARSVYLIRRLGMGSKPEWRWI
ncbi:MAG: hypothetical protein IJP53_02515 [Synergistaceae bacterium]|nr:hypothetical protein [Synergistaceae bacterium]